MLQHLFLQKHLLQSTCIITMVGKSRSSSYSHKSVVHVVTNYMIDWISKSLQAVQRSLKTKVIYKGAYFEVYCNSHLFSLPFCLKSFRPLESVWEAESAGRKGFYLGKNKRLDKFQHANLLPDGLKLCIDHHQRNEIVLINFPFSHSASQRHLIPR